MRRAQDREAEHNDDVIERKAALCNMGQCKGLSSDDLFSSNDPGSTTSANEDRRHILFSPRQEQTDRDRQPYRAIS